MWMHACMFAVASSLGWQTLTVSANVFAHLENVCVKLEREDCPSAMCSGKWCGQNVHVLSDGSQQVKEWRRWRIKIFLLHAEALRDSFSAISNNTLQMCIHSASPLELTWAEKLNNEFSQSLGRLACQPLIVSGKYCGLSSTYSSESVGC